MRHKIAVIITNYNMPERADAVAEHLAAHSDPSLYDLYLVDNGSDIMPPAEHTTVFVKPNRQTTGGFLAGLDAADARGEDYLAYWFIITSAELVDPVCYLTVPMMLFHAYPDVVGIHPALTADSTTAWEHLKTDRPKFTWMLDTIAVFWRADWFNSIGRFDPRLIYGWGIDLETSYLARTSGKRMLVGYGPKVRKITDIGYTLGRMNMTAEDRRRLAAANMQEVLSEKYGSEWRYKMMEELRHEQLVSSHTMPALLRED